MAHGGFGQKHRPQTTRRMASGGLTRRQWLTRAAGATAVVTAGGFPWVRRAHAATRTVSLFIGTTPDYANIYVARDKGFLEAEGLKLDIRLFPSGSAATDAYRSGKVEFVASGDIPAIRLWKAMGTKLIAPTSYDGFSPVFMVKSAIKGPEDLKGKTLATRIGSSGEFFVQLVRQKYDLPADAFKLINLEPPDMVAVLERGDIDGFFWFSPFEERSMQISGSKVRLFLRGGEVGYNNEVALSTRADLIQNEPDTIIRFLRGLIKGSDYAMSHKEETTDIVAAAIKLERKSAEVTQKMNFPVRFDERLYRYYYNVSKFLVAKKMVDQPVDFDSFFWTKGVGSVDPARVEKMAASY